MEKIVVFLCMDADLIIRMIGISLIVIFVIITIFGVLETIGTESKYIITGLTVFLLLILFVTIVVFFTNIFSYVLDTDTKLNQYYNEQKYLWKECIGKRYTSFPYCHNIIKNAIILHLDGLII